MMALSLSPQIFKLLSQDAMKALKAYNTEALNRFHKRKVHNTDVVEIPQDDPPEPLTEKIQGTQQGNKMSHNVGTRLFSGFPVSFASGVVKRNYWMKQQSNTQKQGHLQLSKLAVWVLCMGTEPNSTQQVGYVGIQ